VKGDSDLYNEFMVLIGTQLRELDFILFELSNDLTVQTVRRDSQVVLL